MLPLLALLGAGAWGQDAYLNRQGQEAQGRVRGLLGSAPETLPAGVAGPANPGTGLMADPADPRRQLEFAAGLMGLPRRERAAAGTLFDSIMGRASQGALQREGWTRQEAAAALAEGNHQKRWEAEQARIDAQFQATNGLARERFEEDKRQYGENQAWEKYKFRQQQAIAWRADARAESAAALEKQLQELRIAQAKGEGDAKLSPGYERVQLVNPDGSRGRVVARPIEGTPDWVKAQEGVDQLALARDNIRKFQASLQKHGTEQVGAGAGEQKQLWSRVMASIGKLDELGTLQAGDLERLKEELPDPTAIMRGPLSTDRMQTALLGLDQTFATKERLAAERYRGWGIRFRTAGELAPAPRGGAPGRDAPPAGSKPIGGR